MRPITCELSEFSGRTHKLGLCVWVSGTVFRVGRLPLSSIAHYVIGML